MHNSTHVRNICAHVKQTIVVRKPPTIAEIVRQKTDDGARIIDFFLDLMEGRVDDAKLCHRIDAAKQLVKYGSKEAADFIAEHGDETCDHCESRKRGPRPRKDQSPAARAISTSRVPMDMTSSRCLLRTSSPWSPQWTKT